MENLKDGILIGVTSFVNVNGEGKCDNTGAPDVYANVAWARDWIKQISKV